MRILIPSALYSYTQHRGEVEVSGATVADLIDDLDRQFPGIRFRVIDEQGAIRPHMRAVINGEVVALKSPVNSGDSIALVMALSGG